MSDDEKKSLVRERLLSYADQPEKIYTYGDYLTWPDDERYEIIDGKVYDMSAAPLRIHQEILGELFVQFSNYLKGKPCKVYIAPFDVRIPEGDESEEEVKNVVHPDLSVFCDHGKLDEKGSKDAPDLVVEIVSPSTLKKDLSVKKALYERSGVQQYWLVYPSEKAVLVYELDERDSYTKMESYGKEDTVKIGLFNDFTIELKTVFED
ncbi:MAG TPA: Uma2 family endonuclease [Bacillales bacterium]|nr:Uma2 family endonuclease [Bacillales bacterium]